MFKHGIGETVKKRQNIDRDQSMTLNTKKIIKKMCYEVYHIKSTNHTINWNFGVIIRKIYDLILNEKQYYSKYSWNILFDFNWKAIL